MRVLQNNAAIQDDGDGSDACWGLKEDGRDEDLERNTLDRGREDCSRRTAPGIILSLNIRGEAFRGFRLKREG